MPATMAESASGERRRERLGVELGRRDVQWDVVVIDREGGVVMT